MKTSKTSLPLLSVSVLLLAGASAGCFSVEAEIPDVEVTQRDLAFEGVPFGGLIGEVSMTRSFSQKHDKLDLPEGLDSEIKALRVSLKAKTGIEDFSFISNLRLTMTDDVHPPVELINYQREQDGHGGKSKVLNMKSENPVNTLDQWKTDSATFTIEVAGTLPEQAWTVDLGIHFAGKVKFSY